MAPGNTLVGNKLTGTGTKCIVIEDSNASKTKSTTTENKFSRGRPLGGTVASQSGTQFDHEGAKGDDGVIPQPPTGNINKGPGAGAINHGEGAASIIKHESEINFKLSKEDFEASVPSSGSINKGPGAGGVNCGKWSATIINCKEPINF